MLLNTPHKDIYNGLHCNKKAITEKGMQELGDKPENLPRYKIWLLGDSCQLINLGAGVCGKSNQGLAGAQRPCSCGSDMICIWGFQHQRELVPFWVPGVQCYGVLTREEDVNYIKQGRKKKEIFSDIFKSSCNTRNALGSTIVKVSLKIWYRIWKLNAYISSIPVLSMKSYLNLKEAWKHGCLLEQRLEETESVWM